jgi:hypothetical protein
LKNTKDQKIPIQKLSLKYGIPRSSLKDHFEHPKRFCKRGSKPALNEMEETSLVNWIDEMLNRRFAVIRKLIKAKVKQALPNLKCSNGWWSR